MSEAKYAIGDRVYLAMAGREPKNVPCPDCRGEKTWQCILPSGEVLTIACPTCDFGFDGSRGYLVEHEFTPEVRALTIGSVRMDTNEKRGPFSYMAEETGVGTGSVYYESQLFSSREEAYTAAETLTEEAKIQLEESRARSVGQKRRKTGSMTAHYRAQIRSAQKDIEAAERGLAREAKRHREQSAQGGSR